MLFEDHGPIAIVEGPSPVAGFEIPEGLDARESLPPLESPNRLMTFDGVARTGNARRSAKAVDRAVNGRGAGVVRARALRGAVAVVVGRGASRTSRTGWTSLVAPAWPGFAAGRAAISRRQGCLRRGRPTPTTGWRRCVRVADIADAVLRVEAVRQCVAAGRPLDAELLKQAIRQSDLLLVHYADGVGAIIRHHAMNPTRLAVACLIGLSIGHVQAQSPRFDVIIRHGTVIDGSGNPRYDADIGVRNGFIVAIGDLGGAAGAHARSRRAGCS